MRRYFFLILSMVLFSWRALALSHGDTISIYYGSSYFIGSNDAGTAITSSSAYAPPSINYLWRVEVDGSQVKFMNIGTDMFLSVTASGSTVSLKVNSTPALFTYTKSSSASSSSPEMGKLYYTYKSKKYYIRRSGTGYAMGTSNSSNVLSFNRMTRKVYESLTYTTPTNVVWGYHEVLSSKETPFGITINSTVKYVGKDETSHSFTVSTSTVSDPSILQKPKSEGGYGILVNVLREPTPDVIYVDDVGTNVTDAGWTFKFSPNMGYMTGTSSGITLITSDGGPIIGESPWKDEYDVTPPGNLVNSWKVQVTYGSIVEDFPFNTTINRYFTDEEQIFELSVTPSSYTFPPSESDVGSGEDFSWKNYFSVKRIIRYSSKIVDGDGVLYSEKDGVSEDDNVFTSTCSCLYNISLVSEDKGRTVKFSYSADGVSDGPNQIVVQPTGSNTSGSEWFDTIHIRYNYTHDLGGYYNYYPKEMDPTDPAALSDDDNYIHVYVPISQLANMPNDRYTSQKGASDRAMVTHGLKPIQSVHESFSTIYCIPESVIRLKLHSTTFGGWQRWFDYDNDYSIPTKMDLWYTKPKATVSGKAYDFLNIGNEGSTLSRGEYFAYGRSPFPSSNPSYNTPQIYMSSEYWIAEEDLLPMNVACDISNYTDFSFTTVSGSQMITGPTLSMRQVFQLRHADEMVAKMNAVKSSTTSDAEDLEYRPDMGYGYLEEHVCIAPANRNITLSTEYKYLSTYEATSEWGYIYKPKSSGGTSTYLRVGDSGSGAETAQWYRNGVRVTLGDASSDVTYAGSVSSATNYFITNPHSIPTGKTEETVIYTLRTNSYRIARYVVTYKPVTEVGPIAESGSPARAILTNNEIYNSSQYVPLSRNSFDPKMNEEDTWTQRDGNGNYYTAPGTTALRAYNVPLAFDECTYGFVYSRPNPLDSKPYRNKTTADVRYGEKNVRQGGGDAEGFFPYFGEYMFVNKIYQNINGYVIRDIEQRGGAANGYMIYCDGMEEPGLVASLKVDGNLCAGRKLYCSAWLNNVTRYSGSNDQLPKFRFVVEGEDDDNVGTWETVTEFLTGDLAYNSGWCQIMFPVDLDAKFDRYRLSIYNFANTGTGNDFAIDDIVIFTQAPPIQAYQTSTSCEASSGSDLSVQALVRIDYLGLMDESFYDHDLYYRIYDETRTSPLNAGYLGGRSDYGVFHLPEVGYIHSAADPAHCFTSLESFVTAHKASPTLKYGYVWEHIKDEERYVLYIIGDIYPDPDVWTTNDNVLIQVATAPEDFGYDGCQMEAPLPLKDKLEVRIDGEPIAPKYCPNIKYRLEMNIFDYNVSDASIVDAEGRCLNDWVIVSSDMTLTADERIGKTLHDGVDVFAEEHRGYTYEEVENAILDLRREPTDIMPNSNYTVSSLAEIHKDELLNPESFTIISELVKAGTLILGRQYIDAYLPESGLDFMVLPISGTAFQVNRTTKAKIEPIVPMGLCFEPHRAVMDTHNPDPLKLHLGKKAYDDWTLEERINPYKLRMAKVRLDPAQDPSNSLKIAVPMHDISHVKVISVELDESDDPEFNPATHWYGLTYNAADNKGKESYNATDSLVFAKKTTGIPAGKTRYNKFKGGKQYTFCITWQDEETEGQIRLPCSDYSTLHNTPKNCDAGYSYVTFCIVPDTMVWTPAPNMGESWFTDANWRQADKITGDPIGVGFIPLADTHVIIPKNEDERYPQIDPGDDLEKVPEAKKILLLDSAMIFGQNLLSYDTAFVDMSVPSAQWTIISPALQGTFSGDMYIPNDVAHDNVLFVPKTLDDNRSAFPFWQSFYNTQVVQENFNPLNNITLYNSAWGPFANTLTAEYLPGTGYAILGFDDTDEEGNTLLIRLPKRETQYDYFIRPTPGAPAEPSGRKADIDRADRGKFAYTPGTITITNHEPGKLFVFGNPTMALINMKKFLAANTHLKPIFYYMDGGALSVYSEITSVSDDEHLLPPMRGVIVQLKDAEPDATTLNVTLDNSMLATSNDEERPVLHAPHRLKSNADRQLLYITAQNGSNYSSVVIGEMKGAENGYGEEDALLVTAGAGTTFKSTAFNTTINLYTACGKDALSIDFRDKITMVPLGLYFPNLKERKDMTDLVFNGVESWGRQLFLYDVDTDTETEIFEGLVLTVETPENEDLRYYIRAGKAENEHSDITTDLIGSDDVQGYSATIDFITLSKGQLKIVGSENIDNVQVFDATGKLVANVNGGSKILTVNLPQGVYVAKAQSGLTTKNACVIIK